GLTFGDSLPYLINCVFDHLVSSSLCDYFQAVHNRHAAAHHGAKGSRKLGNRNLADQDPNDRHFKKKPVHDLTTGRGCIVLANENFHSVTGAYDHQYVSLQKIT